MMQTEYIIIGTYAIVWCMAMLRCYGYLRMKRAVGKAKAKPEPSDLPPLSVIIPTYEQCDALQRNLPTILKQEYPQTFEVIVVDMRSTDETLTYLESLAIRFPHLHVTRIPETARSVSLIRLALTLGIRAASHEWIVLTQPNCRPVSPDWLLRMGQTCSEKKETKMVLGYTQFRREAVSWNALRCRFFRLWQQMLHLPYALRHGAYRADGTNLCYRRSLFLQHRGFADHSNLLVGATDIMVNRNSTKENTAVCLHPDAFMEQETPRYARWWRQERLFFMETRRHFSQGLLYRLKYAGLVGLTWLFTLSTVGALLLSLLWLKDSLTAIVVAVLWVLHAICRAYTFTVSTKELGAHPIILTLPVLLHLIPLWDSIAWLHWLFTKKKTFQKKFI